MPKWKFQPPSRNTDRPYSWRVFWSYLPDWVLTIFLWGVFYLLDKINGYRRLFDVTDTSLMHPMADPERIPVWMLAVLYGIVPALIIVLTGALHRSFWDVHSGLLGFILALGLGVTFTDIIKITTGRPRPDLFARCGLPPGIQNPEYGLTSWTVCTNTEHLREGFRSFPSGHSSFAWTSMIYLFMYLAAKLRTYNGRGYAIKSWILLIPLAAASLVSVSRTMDYRHHATDVIAGAIIGLATGWWGYRQYYPALASRKSWKPYSPRIPRDDGIPLHNVENVPLQQRRDASNVSGGTSESATYPPVSYANNTSTASPTSPTYAGGVGNSAFSNGPGGNDVYDAQHAPSMPMPAFTHGNR